MAPSRQGADGARATHKEPTQAPTAYSELLFKSLTLAATSPTSHDPLLANQCHHPINGSQHAGSHNGWEDHRLYIQIFVPHIMLMMALHGSNPSRSHSAPKTPLNSTTTKLTWPEQQPQSPPNSPIMHNSPQLPTRQQGTKPSLSLCRHLSILRFKW